MPLLTAEEIEQRAGFSGIECGLQTHIDRAVVDGKIAVDDPEFKDGTDVFILTREREGNVRLSPEELAELEAGIAEADRGEIIPGDEFFARLRRHG